MEIDVNKFVQLTQGIKQNIQQVIVGKDEAIENILVCLVANGHVLIEDVPPVVRSMEFVMAFGVLIGKPIEVDHVIFVVTNCVGSILQWLRVSSGDQHDFLNHLLIYRRVMAVRSNDYRDAEAICKLDQGSVHSFGVVRHYLNVIAVAKDTNKALNIFLG